jgi:two-component system response regulator
MKQTKRDTVLFADDGLADRDLFRLATSDAFWRNKVIEFEDGEELVEYLKRSSGELPALIVLDLKMPKMTGFDVVKWIRRRREWDAVPIIVLSCSTLESDVQKAMTLGATEYRVKPVLYSDLVHLAIAMRERWLDHPHPRHWPERVFEGLPGLDGRRGNHRHHH